MITSMMIGRKSDKIVSCVVEDRDNLVFSLLVISSSPSSSPFVLENDFSQQRKGKSHNKTHFLMARSRLDVVSSVASWQHRDTCAKWENDTERRETKGVIILRDRRLRDRILRQEYRGESRKVRRDMERQKREGRPLSTLIISLFLLVWCHTVKRDALSVGRV